MIDVSDKEVMIMKRLGTTLTLYSCTLFTLVLNWMKTKSELVS
jgi:hypothetical protein